MITTSCLVLRTHLVVLAARRRSSLSPALPEAAWHNCWSPCDQDLHREGDEDGETAHECSDDQATSVHDFRCPERPREASAEGPREVGAAGVYRTYLCRFTARRSDGDPTSPESPNQLEPES